MRDDNLKWPGGKIYYDFRYPDTNTRTGWAQMERIEELQLVQTIEACMQRWMMFVNADGQTHIEFIRGKDQPVFKLIDLTVSGGSGSGGFGYSGGTMTIAWGYPDDHIKSIPHELGHVMGLLHENDRVVGYLGDATNAFDGTNPMMCPRQGAFIAQTVASKRHTYQPVDGYDIWSIMHYPESNQFGWNCEYPQLEAYMRAHPDPVFKPVRPAFTLARWNQNRAMPCPLNYPTRQEVENELWAPSHGDVVTLRQWYGGIPSARAA
jgi:hypothetical protein